MALSYADFAEDYPKILGFYSFIEEDRAIANVKCLNSKTRLLFDDAGFADTKTHKLPILPLRKGESSIIAESETHVSHDTNLPDSDDYQDTINRYVNDIVEVLKTYWGMPKFVRDCPASNGMENFINVFTKDYTYEHDKITFIPYHGVDVLLGFWVDKPCEVRMTIGGVTVFTRSCIPDRLELFELNQVVPVMLLQYHHTCLIGPITRVLCGARSPGSKRFLNLMKFYENDHKATNNFVIQPNYIIKEGLVTNLPS